MSRWKKKIITREDIENKKIPVRSSSTEAVRLRAEVFVSNLIACNFVESEAYSRTFSSTGTVSMSAVCKYIRKPIVQGILFNRMKELLAKNNLTSEQVVSEVVNIAKSDIRNFVEITDNKTRVKTLEEMGDSARSIKRVIIEEKVIESKGNNKVLDRKIVFELYDKLKALELLMKRTGEIKETNNFFNINAEEVTIQQAQQNYFNLLK